MLNRFSPLAVEWLTAADTDQNDQTQVTTHHAKPKTAFLVGANALVKLMSCGAKLCQSHTQPLALWLEDSAGNDIDIKVRSGLLQHMFNCRFVELNHVEDRKKRVYGLTKKGERESDNLFGVKEQKEQKAQKEEKAKTEDDPRPKTDTANKHIIEHAIGPFAEGYMLQVIFDDLEALVKVAKGIGIERPQLETVTSIVTPKPVELLTPVNDLGKSQPTVSIISKKKKSDRTPEFCNVCGDLIPVRRGNKPKEGIRFCIKTRCQEEQKKYRNHNREERKKERRRMAAFA